MRIYDVYFTLNCSGYIRANSDREAKHILRETYYDTYLGDKNIDDIFIGNMQIDKIIDDGEADKIW